jgi:uncharacterized protein (DUF2235 family)
MPKRLVVCCDGTWNRPDQLNAGIPAPTNVSKFALAVARHDDAGVEQRMHYVRGVGTGRLDHIRGGAFGVGLSHNVIDAYRFIVETYEPGDDLFVLGFSRGAYTARSTVGLVRNSGVLLRENRDHVPEAFALYRNRNDRSHPNGTEAQMFRRMYCHPDPDIHFVGVWDTVGSLGIPGPDWLTKRWSFHDTTLSSHVRNAFHALAIDERRKPFRPTLWQQQAGVDQTLEQRWFAGAHCDVGGGYADPALAELALQWMVEKARDCGLAFDPAPACDRANALGEIHDSYKSFYELLGPYQRPLQADGGAVSESVLARRDAGIGYDPPALATSAAIRATASA